MVKYHVIFYFFILLTFAYDDTISTGRTCCLKNYIQVSGYGKSSSAADVAILNLSFDQKGKTSNDALNSLSGKVNEANALLKKNGIGLSSIETGSLNVFPEYNYLNGKNEVIGQRATQTLIVKVKQIDSKGGKMGIIID